MKEKVVVSCEICGFSMTVRSDDADALFEAHQDYHRGRREFAHEIARRRSDVVAKIRQAGLHVLDGTIVTALELLDEARALLVRQLGEEEHGNSEDGPVGPD